MGVFRIHPEAPFFPLPPQLSHSQLSSLTRQLLPEEDASRVFITHTSTLQEIDYSAVKTVCFSLPPDLTPSFKAIFASQEYFIQWKALSTTGSLISQRSTVQLLAGGSLDRVRSLQGPSKVTTQLRKDEKVMATLSVTPTVCLTGGQLTVRLSEKELPLAVEVNLECVEAYIDKERVCQLVRQYRCEPCLLDSWEQLIPLAPHWEASFKSEILEIEWRLRLKFWVAEEGEFEMIIPLQLYINKELL